MSWTDDRINTLKKMWKEGKSAADIAKSLGKGATRNAVIGKAHRLGLSNRTTTTSKTKTDTKRAAKKAPAKKAAAAKEKPAKAATATAKAKVKPKSKAKVVAPAPRTSTQKKPVSNAPVPPTMPKKEELLPGGGVALIDLTERMCKWPIGDPREDDFTFCGLAIRVGTPYCPVHAAAAYQSSSRRGAAAVAEEPEPDDDEDDDDDMVDDSDDDDDMVEEA